LEPGRDIQLDFDFEGVVSLGEDQTEQAGYGIYNYSQGVLTLSGWYPILAVYDDQGWNLDMPSNVGDSTFSDIAFYTVDVTIPIDFKVIATGTQVERQVSSDRIRLRFESGPARDFFIVAGQDFKVTTRTVTGTTVSSYYLPGHERGGGLALSVASDSLRIFNQKFGAYPYTELDLVETPMQYALGVEFPGIFLVSTSLYDAPEKAEFSATVAHEVAHQWWYNVVGNDVFDEPWLDEALATYSSSLFYEFRVGGSVPDGLIQYWYDRYNKLLNDGEDDLVTENLMHFESLEKSRVYGSVVYSKGALFFKALRDEIGDRAFFAALQAYYQMHQYQIATAEALLDAFERTAGRQLDKFYRTWLYSKGK
jgi:aminopeptidase N